MTRSSRRSSGSTPSARAFAVVPMETSTPATEETAYARSAGYRRWSAIASWWLLPRTTPPRSRFAEMNQRSNPLFPRTRARPKLRPRLLGLNVALMEVCSSDAHGREPGVHRNKTRVLRHDHHRPTADGTIPYI